MLFSFTFAFTVECPPDSSPFRPVFVRKPATKILQFRVTPRDERREGKDNKVFTLNPLCNSEICEMGEEVKAFF